MRQAGLALWQNVLKDPLVQSLPIGWRQGAKGFRASQFPLGANVLVAATDQSLALGTPGPSLAT